AVAMRDAVPRLGLGAPWRGATLRELARRALTISRGGLRGRARTSPAGEDESVFLAPLEAIVAGAPSQAEHWLARFHGAWGGNTRRIFAEAAAC
ncbi:MAG: glutamate--cysteine ligase, partial [Acetobacteraceae bacterium]